ncbi:MAG: hypothetical protein AAF417_16505 [Pseudomonadota bacterium]
MSTSCKEGTPRRCFLQAVVSVPLVSFWTSPSAANDVVTALRGVFLRPASARSVGLAVLRGRTGPSAKHDLVAELEEHRPELCEACGVVSRDRLASMLCDARRSDFEGGHTVIVDGWLLGRSEALVCALIAVG